MNLEELVSPIISKKMGVAIVGIIALVKVGAESWQIMAVTVTAIIVQGVLDRIIPKEIKKGEQK